MANEFVDKSLCKYCNSQLYDLSLINMIYIVYKNNQIHVQDLRGHFDECLERIQNNINNVKHILLNPPSYLLTTYFKGIEDKFILCSFHEGQAPIFSNYNGYMAFYERHTLEHLVHNANVYFGSVSFIPSHDRIKKDDLSVSEHIEKLNLLKNNSNIYFYGKKHFGRSDVLQLIENKYKVIYDNVNVVNEYILDRMNETNCFCAISLDGFSVYCYRDFELAYNFVPTIRYSFYKGNNIDISYNNGFWVCNDSDSRKIYEIIDEVKAHLLDNNYDHMISAKKYANGLYFFDKKTFFPLIYVIEAVFRNHNLLKDQLILNDSLDVMMKRYMSLKVFDLNNLLS